MVPASVSMKAQFGEVNTLSHYLAMHDDLYCSVIYQQFCLNPFTRGNRPDIFEKSVLLRKELSDSIQSYLSDACRIFNLKIFQAELYTHANASDSFVHIEDAEK